MTQLLFHRYKLNNKVIATQKDYNIVQGMMKLLLNHHINMKAI